MKNALVKLLLTGLSGFLVSCNFLPGAQSGGSCATADGRNINTYTIYGTWKQVQGYEEGGRTDEDLEENYDILAVLRTGAFCKFEVANGADTGNLPVVADGTYSHDIDTGELTLSIINDSRHNRSGEQVVGYRFTGRCDNTKMTWVYDDGKTEVFKVRGKSVEGVSCQTE